MANLLTNETKQYLQRDFWRRKLITAGLVLGLLLVISLVILGSIWVSLFIRVSSLAKISSTVSRELKEVKGPSDPVALLKKIKDQVKIINSYWSEPLVSMMIIKASALKPAGLKLSGLVIERGEVGKITKLSLVGLADSRNQLVNYVNFLRQDKFFSRVDLPVESLISDRDGQFVINLEK